MTAEVTGTTGADDPGTHRDDGGGSDDSTLVRRLRGGLILVAALTVAGTVVELAFQRHWTQPVQFVAWAALLLLGIAIVLLVRRPDPGTVRVVRTIAIIVGVASLLGFVEHVIGNYDAGPLDAVYGEQWDTMSELAKWWQALIQGVGPSPALAPGVLVQASLCLWLATIGLTRSSPSEAPS